MYISRDISQVRPGDKFVVRSSGNSSKYEILRMQIDGGHRYGVRPDGQRVRYDYITSGFQIDGSRHYLEWCEPLPDLGNDADVIAYVKSFSAIKEVPHVFHVTSVTDNEFKGRLVFFRTPQPEDMEFQTDETAVEWTWTSQERLKILDQETVFSRGNVNVGVGDLIVVDGLSLSLEDDAYKVRTEFHRVHKLGTNVPQSDLNRYLPARETPDGGWSVIGLEGVDAISIGDPANLTHEQLAARLRLEDNEALVLWMKGGQLDDTYPVFLCTKGYLFHVWDSPADEFYNANIPEGLWVCKNANGWSYQSYEGEWDGGIDADWEPATMEDIERYGFTKASLSEEIKEYLEEAGYDVNSSDAAEIFMEKALNSSEISLPMYSGA